MTDPLLTIGAFARAVGLPPGALRHYDDVGLLPPADVDEATGYRYYTPDLIRRAGLIARMREIGLPIDTMRVVLDGPSDTAGATLREFVIGQVERTARAERAVAEILAAAAAGRTEPVPARLRVDGPGLAAAVRQVRVAADTDPRSPLGSVLLDAADGLLDVVATNRHWMAARTIKPLAGAGRCRAVLSLDDADVLANGLDATVREGGVAELTIDPDRVDIGGDEVPVRDVDYPAHRALVEGLQPPVAHVLAGRAELADAVARANRAEVDLVLTGDGLRIAAGDERPWPVRATTGGAQLTVRLGTALIQRALASVVGPEVVIAVAADARPVRILAPHQPGFLALVMPIKQG